MYIGLWKATLVLYRLFHLELNLHEDIPMHFP